MTDTLFKSLDGAEITMSTSLLSQPSIDKRIRRIKSPAQREAIVHWIKRFSNTTEPSVLERLALDWLFLTRRHSKAEDHAQLYYALFSRLARLPADRLPSTETVRYLLRSLRRFPFTHCWERLKCELSEAAQTITSSKWQLVHEQCRRIESDRLNAKITFAVMHPLLEELSTIFAAGEQPLPLEQTKASLNSLTAFTDGKKIYLGDAVAISPHKSLNRLAYARLLLHEYLHPQLGHFDYSFRTPSGKEIWDQLKSRRAVFNDNRRAWSGMEMLKQLLAEGEYIPEGRRPFLPHLQAFLMHFNDDCQSGIHGLLNILLDVMVEKQLALDWPELGEIAEVIQQYETALRPDPRFMSPAQNFRTAIFDRAFGKESLSHVSSLYQSAFIEIAAMLDSYGEGPVKTIYASVETTIQIVEIMERHLPTTLFTQGLSDFGQYVSVSIEEAAFRRELSAEKFDPIQPGQKATYPFGDEQRPEGVGDWYDEFNAWENTTEEKAVFVVEKPWKAFRSPYALSAVWNPRRFDMQPHSDALFQQSTYSSEGVNLDLDRYHDFYVGVQTGVSADDRVFLDDIEQRASASEWAITFVVDLTVSMEAVRSKYSPVPPIALALETIESLSFSLEQAGIPTAVWGVHDMGRRSVTLWQAKTFEQPFDPEVIRSMHAIGVGGARFGAVIRHASSIAKKQLSDRQHMLVILTDAASHYQTIGIDDFLSKQIVSRTCSKCQIRPNCWVEPIDPRIDLRRKKASVPNLNLYYPTFYETADIQNAIKSSPNLTTIFVVSGTHYSRSLLDKTYGSNRWMTLLSRADYSRIRRIFQRLLRESPTKPLT